MTKVPDKRGQWWRDDCADAVLVYGVYTWNGADRVEWVWYWLKPRAQAGFFTKLPVTDDGHWQGPCIRPSVPLPAPKAGGREVTPGLVADLLEHGFDDAAHLVLERDAFGRAKWGQPLMTDDGQDTIEASRQETGDLLQYATKAKMEGKDISPIRALVPALLYVLGVG